MSLWRFSSLFRSVTFSTFRSLQITIIGLVKVRDRVRDVVFLHNNLRLANKTTDIDYTEPNIEWGQQDSETD